MKRATLLSGMIAFLLCTGCAGGAATVDNPQASRPIPVYHLAPDDKIKITVYGEDALTGEYIVRSDGDVSFPLVGAVKASGLTLAEFQAALTAKLAAGALNNPRVTAVIEEYRPFYILGEVNKAGQYPYRVGMTVNAAVATAGGFTYRANHKTVAIQHRGEAGEQKYRLTPDLPVMPGDTVRVLERFF
ncbi:MAG TPA: polysaccharide biosynthesis/export family protein [Sphingomonadaceae bacterium]|nr:polysaccharide biosynthesis/export family protein [Sphingomonadaceae bacterium]